MKLHLTVMTCEMNRQGKKTQGDLEVTQRISKHQECIVPLIVRKMVLHYQKVGESTNTIAMLSSMKSQRSYLDVLGCHMLSAAVLSPVSCNPNVLLLGYST